VQGAADPQRALGIRREHGGDQTELGTVGDPDGLVLVAEGDPRDDRAEDLLLRDAHVGGRR